MEIPNTIQVDNGGPSSLVEKVDADRSGAASIKCVEQVRDITIGAV